MIISHEVLKSASHIPPCVWRKLENEGGSGEELCFKVQGLNRMPSRMETKIIMTIIQDAMKGNKNSEGIL